VPAESVPPPVVAPGSVRAASLITVCCAARPAVCRAGSDTHRVPVKPQRLLQSLARIIHRHRTGARALLERARDWRVPGQRPLTKRARLDRERQIAHKAAPCWHAGANCARLVSRLRCLSRLWRGFEASAVNQMSSTIRNGEIWLPKNQGFQQPLRPQHVDYNGNLTAGSIHIVGQLIASLTGLPTRLSISTSVSIVNLDVFLFTTSDTRGRETIRISAASACLR
jgi:hypothetical protein